MPGEKQRRGVAVAIKAGCDPRICLPTKTQQAGKHHNFNTFSESEKMVMFQTETITVVKNSAGKKSGEGGL